MTELSVRPYADGDAAALCDVFNDVEVANGGEPEHTETDTRNLLEAWVRDHANDTRLVMSGDRLVAAGLLLTPPPGGQHIDLLGAVHPDFQGRGIGRELLTWQFDRARTIHADVAADEDWHAETSANGADKAATALFERFEMSPVRYFFGMEASLDGVASVELPDRIRAAPYTEDLSEAVYETHMAAFADHWGFQRRPYAMWVKLTLQSDQFRPDLSRIGLDGEDIAGYVLAYDGPGDVEYVGQVGTRREWRRRGLASALLAESMAAGAKDGKTSAKLGVDADSPTGAVGVYERVGFHTRQKYVVYRTPLERA
ncbi:MAG TPA: GNAT family N-acetyltransferase [Micromonosporaceae bacterium]|jgi:ribosomal protein S18 acetylase RimI-like enzyme|nr:GNAT family N-acetyltransferase [Micromonosporaceae bacterium]